MSEELSKGLKMGSQSNPLILKLKEYEGLRLVDIRKWFIDKETRTLQPTRKGISINGKVLKELRAALNEYDDQISAWLMQGEDNLLARVTEAMEARTKMRDEEAARARPYTVKSASWSAPNSFAVESHGGEDELCLNAKHELFSRMQQNQFSAVEVRELLGMVFMSFYRAKLRFPGELEVEADRFFDALEFEWGSILRNYVRAASH